MEFILENKGVCYDKNTEILTNIFGYSKTLILKTFFTRKKDEDELIIPMYFINKKENILSIKRIGKEGCSAISSEIALRSVCKQFNENRKELIRRTTNKKIRVCFNFVKFEADLDFYNSNIKLIETSLKELGYEDIVFDYSLDIQNETIGELMFRKPAKEQLRVYDEERDDYLDWDTYFMGHAVWAAQRSKDPSTQVGACIVSPDNRIISTGYNGAPTGWLDFLFPWGRKGDYHNTKYPLVVHSESNAISHFTKTPNVIVEGSRMYVTLFPCNQCAQFIKQAGIKEVIFLCDKYCKTDGVIAAKRIFDTDAYEGVKYRMFCPEKDYILKLR